jgi:hypothetical protein
MINCRARVEVRAVMKPTNETITAESAQAGGLDLTEEIAGKVALENAAEEVGKRLVEKLLFLPAGATRQIEVIVSGLPNLQQAEQAQDLIRKMPGVRKIERDDYFSGIAYFDVELDNLTSDTFPGALEKASQGKIDIFETSKLTVRGNWVE